MRLRSAEISTRTLGGETIVLSLPNSRYFTITGVGTRILELLVEDKSAQDVVDAVVEEYEVDRAVAERDVNAFLGRLRDAELLV